MSATSARSRPPVTADVAADVAADIAAGQADISHPTPSARCSYDLAMALKSRPIVRDSASPPSLG